mgnify:CR=1 FL=1
MMRQRPRRLSKSAFELFMSMKGSFFHPDLLQLSQPRRKPRQPLLQLRRVLSRLNLTALKKRPWTSECVTVEIFESVDFRQQCLDDVESVYLYPNSS